MRKKEYNIGKQSQGMESMDYFCICMSPAIDANVTLDRAPKGEGEIFKNVRSEENAGGKTINVARWLAIRGASVVCAGLLGEDNAELFVKEFAKYGIGDRMTRVKGTTRRNMMITWPGGSFKLNQSAFPDVFFDEESFLDGLVRQLAAGNRTNPPVVVLSGSLPKCCGDDFYAKAVKAFKTKGAFVALDASGESMKLALEAGPDLVKPNAEECEPLVGFVPRTAEEFRKATELLRKRAPHVIISDGASGAWFDGDFVAAPEVDCRDTTAAGDTLLAEYCYSRKPLLAVAAGSAAVEMPGSNPPSVERVEELAE